MYFPLQNSYQLMLLLCVKEPRNRLVIYSDSVIPTIEHTTHCPHRNYIPFLPVIFQTGEGKPYIQRMVI